MRGGIPRLPAPRSGDPRDMEVWAHQLVDALHAAFGVASAPAATYAVTNLAAPVRALDAGGGATAAEVSEVLGTVIEDLITAGVLTR